jgi:hypothetical protein
MSAAASNLPPFECSDGTVIDLSSENFDAIQAIDALLGPGMSMQLRRSFWSVWIFSSLSVLLLTTLTHARGIAPEKQEEAQYTDESYADADPEDVMELIEPIQMQVRFQKDASIQLPSLWNP